MQFFKKLKKRIFTWAFIILLTIICGTIVVAQEEEVTQPNQLFLPLILGQEAVLRGGGEVGALQTFNTDASAAENATTGASPAGIDQIIVHYRSTTQATTTDHADQAEALGQTIGVNLQYVREMSGGDFILKLPSRLSEAEVHAIANRIAQQPNIEYAEADIILRHQLTPNDTRYNEQWHYFAPVGNNYGVDLPTAWNITTGAANIVVAVLDTGILNHADLAGRTVAGYDFITNIATANDGNGRDANPSDPGDWCPPFASSWHGTHVAGTIGAKSNNNLGVAGINWESKIQPVRVLGVCGGAYSDIIDAIRWAAGLNVPAVPANATPAKVINMSLSGSGSCGSSLQSAITDATNAGVVVVVAASNDNDNAANYQPASCNGVITVASTNRAGNRAPYSNYGATIEISAPGGDMSSSTTNGVLSTLNTGTTTPAADTYAFYQGTSMAAPHVAGIVSLMFSINASLSPSQVLNILQTTRTPFPSGSNCTTSLCGSGIINAAAAVSAAQGDALNAPTNLSVVAISNSQINLTWNDNSSNETSFQIERCQGTSCTNFTQIATVGVNVTQYSNPGLAANTSYSYRVRATKGGVNSAYSNTASATTGDGSDLIFADSFESGDFSKWSFGYTNGGRLSVSRQAARVGSYGAQATVDDTHPVYLADDRPTAESRYRARFYFHPNSVTMANKKAHPIFYGVQGGGTAIMRIGFQKVGNKYQLRASLLNDATTWTFTKWVTISNAWHALEVDWQASTTTSAKNGSLTFWIDGAQKAIVTKIDNDTRRIDGIWLGPLEGGSVGMQGTYYFDDFVSRRQTYIGPAASVQSALAVETEQAVETVSEEGNSPATVVSTTIQPGASNVLTGEFNGLSVTAQAPVNTGSEPITIMLTSTDTQTMPDGYTLVGDMFTMRLDHASGIAPATYDQPVTLTIDYAAVVASVDQQVDISLQAWNAEAERWEIVPATVNAADHTISAVLNQGATLAVWQQAATGVNTIYLPAIQQ